MNFDNKSETKNKSFMEAIALSDKLYSVCVVLMIATVIVGCVDFILTITHLNDIYSVQFYLNDFEMIFSMTSKFFIYVAIIVVEWILLKISNIINTLATTIFKNDDK